MEEGLKVILVLLSGIADRSSESLGWKTPLQAASLPNFDELASIGSCGTMYPLGPGICPSSDQASWNILGYGKYKYPGRACFEALGAKIHLEPEDVIIWGDLASTTIEGGKRYVQASPSYLPEDDAKEIAASVSGYTPEFFDLRVYHLKGPHILLILKSGASALVTDSDPVFYQNPVPEIYPAAHTSEDASITAAELNRFSSWAKNLLSSHPITIKRLEEGMTAPNYVLLKWPSTYPEVPDFKREWGFQAIAFFSENFFAGLTKALGIEGKAISAKDPYEDLKQKLEKAIHALEDGFDFACIHTSAADEVSRTGRPMKKVRVLEEFDKALGEIKEYLINNPEILFVLTSDHPTPSGGSMDVIHSGESVPILIVGKNTRRDYVSSFDEVSFIGGSLGQIKGVDVMPLILNFTDRAKFGAMRVGQAETQYHKALSNLDELE